MALARGRTRSTAAPALLVMIGAALGLAAFCGPAAAQSDTPDAEADPTTEQAPAERGTNLSFGSIRVSADMPIEVVSKTLEMDQNVNQAVFKGDVLVEHGEMKLDAPRVEVEYGTGDEGDSPSGIIRIVASGGVGITSPEETAKADKAVYTVAARRIVLTGDVVVTQGINSVAGKRMVIDLEEGTAVMIGRVRTFIDPGNATGADTTGDAAAGDAGQ